MSQFVILWAAAQMAAPAASLKPADAAALKQVLSKAATDGRVSGVSLLVAHKGRVVFRAAAGDLNVRQRVKLGSSTKPITATVVMALVDRGLIDLNAAIPKYLPEFADTPAAKAAVRDLLTHTAGFGGYPEGRPRRGTLAEFARTVAAKARIRRPGTFKYSGVNFDLAARICEVVTKAPYESLLKKYVTDPLGMSEPKFVLAADPRTVPTAAKARGEGRYVSGGGGMAATLEDVAAFYQMHLNGGNYKGQQILKPESAAAMRRAYSQNPKYAGNPVLGSHYGLGFYLARPTPAGEYMTINHAGAFGTVPFADRDRDLVAVLFTQDQLPRALGVTSPVQQLLRKAIPQTEPVKIVAEKRPAGGRGGDRLFGTKDRISAAEFKAAIMEMPAGKLKSRPEMIDRVFGRLDANGDGYLTKQEMAAFGKKRGGRR